METGKVKGKWIPSPPVISNVLRFLFPDSIPIPTYPVREKDGAIEVLINIRAREQFEKQYWKGILDARGKADSSYY